MDDHAASGAVPGSPALTSDRVGHAVGRLLAVPVPDPGRRPPSALFEAIEELIRAASSDDVAAIIAKAMDQGRCGRERAGLIIGCAAWCGTDNGQAMQATLDSWLARPDDPDRAWIALHHDAYPFRSHAEMTTRLREVATRYPELADTCEDLITTRQPGS